MKALMHCMSQAGVVNLLEMWRVGCVREGGGVQEDGRRRCRVSMSIVCLSYRVEISK